jgi:cobalt-zinc-cadmium efflux system membrane fusion protein
MTRLLTVLTFLFLLASCTGHDHDDHDHAGHGHAHGHGHDDHEDVPTGPNGGRLLESGDVTLELAIFEDGVPPEFRAWVSRGGQALTPSGAALTVTLTRLGGHQDSYRFVPAGRYLRGLGDVAEPHSFEVRVELNLAGESHQWQYESFEGRVNIPAPIARAAGIETAIAGPRRLEQHIPLHGRVITDPLARARVRARFPGIVREVAVEPGDRVVSGTVLARVEADESLRSYAVTAPRAGVVAARNVNPGELAGGEVLFEIIDPAARLVRLGVLPGDQSRVSAGQTLRLRSVSTGEWQDGKVERLEYSGGEGPAVLDVLASFERARADWRPGTPVIAELSIDDGDAEVALAVPAGALQEFRGFTVVFERVGDDYEVRMLQLGRSDGNYLEVLDGLAPGAEIVVVNSYLIKADIEKSGAAHDH